MVVKSQIKFIKSLQQKKYRNLHGKFVVEGIKVIKELLASNMKVDVIFSTSVDFVNKNKGIATLVTDAELSKMSGLSSPNKVLGVFNTPVSDKIEENQWIVVLDNVRDPGNLGTIIRLCDWFNITQLVCSSTTVDAYNPKVLQATMGSISRVNIVYTDLEAFLTKVKTPIYGAFMNGKVVYEESFSQPGILVMGNEANGISEKIENFITTKISIPQFGDKTAESLNVATATAILVNEIKRSS